MSEVNITEVVKSAIVSRETKVAKTILRLVEHAPDSIIVLDMQSTKLANNTNYSDYALDGDIVPDGYEYAVAMDSDQRLILIARTPLGNVVVIER